MALQTSERYLEVNGVRLHVVEAGEGPTVLLLHGFPECWISWRPVMERLVEAGYRAVAPDMRGYNLSGKPAGVSSYGWDALTGDVLGLVDALGEERVHLVGHDWGAVVAWMALMRAPERFERVGICNVPHPAHYEKMALDPAQLKRSWYIAFFQLPGLPERMLRKDDWRNLRRTLAADRMAGTLSAEVLEEYVEAARHPGALTAMLNYYRAMVRQGPGAVRKRLVRVETPVLVCWGERDRALGVDYAAPPAAWVPNQEVIRYPEASHWVQMDVPDKVSDALIAHFGGPAR